MLSGFGSLAGSAVSSVAIPTLAAVQLGASSGQIALLVFLGQLPAFVIALPAGALADRHRKRPLMITGDLVCAASVAVIPFSAATGRLHMGTLYAVALLVGAARIVHDAATISYLPALVKPQLLHRANARLSGMFAVADGAGSNAGAALVGALGAARAVTADAASYLVSAWWTWRIRAPEQVQSAGPRRRLAA
ncbi:MAG: MFS transporter, partial [Streptomyces sp.]|nr:MFS transporter [Streptomyces sp.]